MSIFKPFPEKKQTLRKVSKLKRKKNQGKKKTRKKTREVLADHKSTCTQTNALSCKSAQQLVQAQRFLSPFHGINLFVRVLKLYLPKSMHGNRSEVLIEQIPVLPLCLPLPN